MMQAERGDFSVAISNGMKQDTQKPTLSTCPVLKRNTGPQGQFSIGAPVTVTEGDEARRPMGVKLPNNRLNWDSVTCA